MTPAESSRDTLERSHWVECWVFGASETTGNDIPRRRRGCCQPDGMRRSRFLSPSVGLQDDAVATRRSGTSARRARGRLLRSAMCNDMGKTRAMSDGTVAYFSM